jgi:type IV pilus assembly protein PilB
VTPPPTDRRDAWTSLGQMLLKRKAITEEQLKTAFDRHRQTRRRLGQVLIEMKLISESTLVECLAEQFRKEFVTEETLATLEADVVKVVPAEVARQHSIIAVERLARKLIVATPDPLNFLALDDVRRTTGLEVDFRIGPPTAILEAIDRCYRAISKLGVDEALRQDLGLSLVSQVTLGEESVDIKQLRTQADDPPVVKLVNYVLSRAASDRASDIHVEAYDDKTQIRYRIDGLLYELLEVPRQLHLAVVSRLKILSRLDIAERRLPQDGSFSIKIQDREIDFRVSSLPTVHGEKMVLRLLEKEAVMHHYTLQSLGFEPDQLALFVDAIRRPWGMILMTGPTGSGKSTTLHTSLKAIKSPRKNIVTVEDPVEYRQPGIQQVQVKAEIGFDFARSLRAILRQDPDIIMIGEIRDSETAQIAVRAALTGHLVFSTLHTNDSVSTLVRLINIGVEPFLVASAVNLCAAQRLVRRICKECREGYEPTPDEKEFFPADKTPGVLYRGRGCKACRNTGFSGRLALYELFPVTSDVRRMVLDGQDTDRIAKFAIGSGMVTLRQCGLRKALEGITSLEEVMSVVADQE